MERDWDLIEKMLESIAESKPFEGEFRIPFEEKSSPEDWDAEEVRRVLYHYGLLKEGGYISRTEVEPAEQLFNVSVMVHVTMKGYDLLQELRDGGRRARSGGGNSVPL